MARDEHDFRGDQFARRRGSLLSLAVVVDSDHFDRLAEQAAGLIELGHRHPDPPFVLLAEPGHRAGQGPRRSDPDLGAGLGNARGNCQNHRDGEGASHDLHRLFR
jgi:hypothetical protein